MTAFVQLLAQFLAQDPAAQSGSIIFITVAIVVLVLVLFVAVVIVRKRLSPDEDFHGEGFSLGDLREMHKNGQLSEEEFERARAKLVEQLHAAQARRDAAQAEASKQKMI